MPLTKGGFSPGAERPSAPSKSLYWPREPEYQSAQETIFCSSVSFWELVKAADRLAAYMKCLEELAAGNHEFSKAEKALRASVEGLAAKLFTRQPESSWRSQSVKASSLLAPSAEYSTYACSRAGAAAILNDCSGSVGSGPQVTRAPGSGVPTT